MRFLGSIISLLILVSCGNPKVGSVASPKLYLSDIKNELQKVWPNNRTINLVFDGHSVPAGYEKDYVVNSFGSYPMQTLKHLKEKYPYAVINIITTAIAGKNSMEGEAKFESDVLIHKPDVLFIDYALNDVSIGAEKERRAYESMIEKALNKKIKVILLTPSPDLDFPVLDTTTPLIVLSKQIRTLAADYGIGLIDSYSLFQRRVIKGDSVEQYISQFKHLNEKGNAVIAQEILTYF